MNVFLVFGTVEGFVEVEFSAQEQERIKNLLDGGVKKDTISKYQRGWDCWMTFLQTKGIDVQPGPYLVSVAMDTVRQLLVLFVWYMFYQLKKSSSVVDQAFSAVSYFFKVSCHDNTIFTDDATIKLAKRSVRLEEKRDPNRRDKKVRLPVTFDMIKYLESVLWSGILDVDKRMAYVGIVLAFHFMLRVSEYVYHYDEDGSKDPSHALMANDVVFITNGGKRLRPWELRSSRTFFSAIKHVLLIVRDSKADQFGKGRNLFISRGGAEEIHLMSIVYDWAIESEVVEGDPFLCRYKQTTSRGYSRKLLPRSEVNKALKGMATYFGFDAVFFSTHCLRIGGATTMIAGGGSREDVQRIAGWASDCDLIYEVLTPMDSGTFAVIDACTLADSCCDILSEDEAKRILTSTDVLMMIPIARSRVQISRDDVREGVVHLLSSSAASLEV